MMEWIDLGLVFREEGLWMKFFLNSELVDCPELLAIHVMKAAAIERHMAVLIVISFPVLTPIEIDHSRRQPSH